MNQQYYDHVVKIMLVGNSGVGKTAFIKRFCLNQYNDKLTSTIGIDYQQKIIQSNEKRVLLQLWDTAGQQRFRNLTPSYYRSAMAIILCYSVEDRQSFISIAPWLKQIKKYTEEQLPIIIVGNKSDLIRRQVLEKQGKTLADSYKIDFIEASAKQNKNINDVVSKIMKKVILKIDKLNNDPNLKLTRSKQIKRSYCSC